MKDLPEDPPVYTPPPERWFERHQHPHGADGKPDLTPALVTRTLCAMWLTLHDRRRMPLPKEMRKFSAADREMFEKLSKKLGDSLMDIWRSACNHTSDCEDVEKAFLNLLAAKGLEDE